MRAVLLSLLLVIRTISVCLAQSTGNLSGGFESNSVYYINDKASDAASPDDRFGSNNFLKLDYTKGKFSAGVVYEAYLPVLQGLPSELSGQKITFKYASFQDEKLTVTVGDFYEQFGSGLALRAYEERLLGLNNSIEGVKVAYRLNDFMQLKAVYGRPRKYLQRAESQLRGLNYKLEVSRLFGWSKSAVSVEASYVNRYERYTGTSESVKPNVNLFSFQGQLQRGAFSVKGEYVYKTADPAIYNDNMQKDGSALLLEAGYNKGYTGALLTVRRLEYMDFRSSRSTVGLTEVANYTPALTRQYTYAIANLNPYAAQSNGEAGGQLDFFHFFPEGSLAGGESGLNFSANGSAYYNLMGTAETGFSFTQTGKTLFYRDLNFDLNKQWNSKLKTTLVFSSQTFNPESIGEKGESYHAQIAVADIVYRFNQKRSLRIEAGHLYKKQQDGNWASLNLTYELAPSWSFFTSDLYNYGGNGVHYYNAGASYSRSATRVALQYGRNRAGYQCAGGVCRLMPAYTGANLSLTCSF